MRRSQAFEACVELVEGLARLADAHRSDHLDADPATVLPRRLASLLVRTARTLPLARRPRSGDAELRRLLTQEAGDRELYARTQPASMCEAALPILRRHGLTRSDRPLPEHAYLLRAVLTAMSEPATAPIVGEDPEAVLADTMTVLLDPPSSPANTPSPQPSSRPLGSCGRSRTRSWTFSSAARPLAFETAEAAPPRPRSR